MQSEPQKGLPTDELGRERARRIKHIGLFALLAVAVVGFLTGIGDRRVPKGYDMGGADASLEVVGQAPSQRDLAERGWGGDRSRIASNFEALAANRPALTDEVVVTEADKAKALEARRARRAYEGAPPVIPHEITQMGPPECLTCHRDGMNVAGKVAPAMSHSDHLVSCTQCHAAAGPVLPTQQTLPKSAFDVENAFVGLAIPTGGARAWNGAPPVIPHPTFMRENCASCHGVLAQGIVSTHPYRQSCQQCHASSASFDQRVPRSDVGKDVSPLQ